jgi:hypothetical protein
MIEEEEEEGRWLCMVVSQSKVKRSLCGRAA